MGKRSAAEGWEDGLLIRSWYWFSSGVSDRGRQARPFLKGLEGDLAENCWERAITSHCLSFVVRFIVFFSSVPGAFRTFLPKILAFWALYKSKVWVCCRQGLETVPSGTGWLTSCASSHPPHEHFLQALTKSVLSCMWTVWRCHWLGCVWTCKGPRCAHLHFLMAPKGPNRPWG